MHTFWNWLYWFKSTNTRQCNELLMELKCMWNITGLNSRTSRPLRWETPASGVCVSVHLCAVRSCQITAIWSGQTVFAGNHSEDERSEPLHRGQNHAWRDDPQTRYRDAAFVLLSGGVSALTFAAVFQGRCTLETRSVKSTASASPIRPWSSCRRCWCVRAEQTRAPTTPAS